MAGRIYKCAGWVTNSPRENSSIIHQAVVINPMIQSALRKLSLLFKCVAVEYQSAKFDEANGSVVPHASHAVCNHVERQQAQGNRPNLFA